MKSRLKLNKMLAMPIVALVLFGCTRDKPTISKRQELDGINGPSFYYFDLETKKIDRVLKKEYESLDYVLGITKDSLSLGEYFKAFFRIYDKEYQVLITEPSIHVINGTPEPVIEYYKFLPPREGIYLMKGRIEYDTVVIPFEYKFIVLPKDQE